LRGQVRAREREIAMRQLVTEFAALAISRVQYRSDSRSEFPNATLCRFHYSFLRSGLMMKFDRRTTANLEVALETVCRKLPVGGDHETRKRVAQALLRAAKSGHTNSPAGITRTFLLSPASA
jgi:hypothetical protein